MNSHDIHFVESLRASRAFSHAILHTIFDALDAKHVAASLQNCILEPVFADGAESKLLYV